MISANEAYSMATPKLEEYRNFLDEKIRVAALQRKTSIIIREQPYSDWFYTNAESKNEDVKRVLKELRDLGYTVREHYHEGQFVDMGLYISWDKNQKFDIIPESKKK